MASLFISYSRKDMDAARKLTDALKGPALDFWIDWEGIPPTVDWWKEIEKDIEQALINRKRLVPVMVRDLRAEDAPQE